MAEAMEPEAAGTEQGGDALRDDVRALVRASAVLGAGRGGGESNTALRDALEAASRRARPRQVEEILLQSYLLLGFPAALNAFAMWREVSGRPAEPWADSEPDTWRQRGQRICQQVYAGQYGRLRENVARLSPEMERWMLDEGYGKVLGRAGVALETRELCNVAQLCALDAERQLHAHLRGALNVGASVAAVDAAVAEASQHISPGRARAAREIWAHVRQRWEAR